MTDDITPALSAKEWAEQMAHNVRFSRTGGHGEIAAHVWATLADVTDGGPEANGETEAVEIYWNNAERSTQLWNRHKFAALCLHQQPYGFTAQDVAMLEWASSVLHHFGLQQIGSRIAALLPPPTPDGS
jgi:hypothetical protein